MGAILEPTLLRPFYKRAEEYQLLVTFGLLMILDDVMRFLWGPYPLSASVLFENFGSVDIGESIYPTYNFLVIARGRPRRRLPVGVHLPHAASAWCCAPPRRTCGWPPPSA